MVGASMDDQPAGQVVLYVPSNGRDNPGLQLVESDDWYGTRAARLDADDEQTEPARDAEGMQLPQSNPPTLNASP